MVSRSSKHSLESFLNLEQACTLVLLKKNNLPFSEFQRFIDSAQFVFRNQEGSHRTYKHPTHECGPPHYDTITVQSVNNKAKPYQVKQVVEFIRCAEPKRDRK